MFVPSLIKRNTALLALSQAFAGAGMQIAYALGPLIVVSLAGSAAVSGITVTVLGLSKFLVAYPVGKVTDTYGRKPGMLMGLVLALVGTVAVGLSINAASFPLFLVGLLVFSMGMNAAQQLRVAAADMYPPSRRAQAVGWVLTGSMAGTVLGPILVTIGQSSAETVGVDPLALPWLMLPLLILPGIAFVRAVNPDPRHIAANLHDYYPGIAGRTEEHRGESGTAATLRGVFSDPARRIAIITNAACHGNMSIAMVTTSLVLAHHGTSLSAISVAGAIHSAGMFGFSLPLGWLADRLGRRAVLVPASFLALIGGVLIAWGSDYALITLGGFLVGLGWAGSNVAATALIADTTEAAERGRAIGLNDSIASGVSICVAVATGLLLNELGLEATGMLVFALMLPALALSPQLPRARPRNAVAEVALVQ